METCNTIFKILGVLDSPKIILSNRDTNTYVFFVHDLG